MLWELYYVASLVCTMRGAYEYYNDFAESSREYALQKINQHQERLTICYE